MKPTPSEIILQIPTSLNRSDVVNRNASVYTLTVTANKGTYVSKELLRSEKTFVSDNGFAALLALKQ